MPTIDHRLKQRGVRDPGTPLPEDQRQRSPEHRCAVRFESAVGGLRIVAVAIRDEHNQVIVDGETLALFQGAI